jgi:hypothetical protein
MKGEDAIMRVGSPLPIVICRERRTEQERKEDEERRRKETVLGDTEQTRRVGCCEERHLHVGSTYTGRDGGPELPVASKAATSGGASYV